MPKMPIAVLAAIVLLSGCKIIQEVPAGGRVVSLSGDNNCASGQTCVIDVENGSPFSETFYAIPDLGYRFAGWKRAKFHLCGDKQEPCAVNASAEFTDSDIDMKLSPMFELDAEAAEVTVSAMLFGPITGASVSVLDAATGNELCAGTTAGPSPAESAGKVALPRACFETSDLSVITVEGGTEQPQLAINAPGSDAAPIDGVLHAVVSRPDADESGFHVSALTEAAFQAVSYLIEAGHPLEDILDELDLAGAKLLGADLNADGTIDHRDLNAWNQDVDRPSLRASEGQVASLSEAVRQGSNIGVEAISAATDPVPRQATLDFPRELSATALAGDYLMAVTSNEFGESRLSPGELYVIDISEPSNPVIVASKLLRRVELSAQVNLQVVDDALIIEAGGYTQRQVALIDISDPTTPVIADPYHYFNFGGSITRFYRVGDLAYVGTSDGNTASEGPFWLDVLKLGSDGKYTSLNRIPLTDAAFDMVAIDSMLYVRTGDYFAGPSAATLLAYRIGDEEGELTQVDSIELGRRGKIVTDGRYLYLPESYGAFGRRVRVYDVGDPESITPVTTTDLVDKQIVGEDQVVAVSGTRLYVGHEHGVRVYDMTDTDRHVPLHNASTDAVVDLTVAGDSIIVANGRAEILSLGIDQQLPNQASPAGSSHPFDARQIASSTDDDIAWVLSNSGTLLAIDTSDPSEKRVAFGSLVTGNYAEGFEKYGNFLYRSGEDLRFYDVRDTANPYYFGRVFENYTGYGFRDNLIFDDGYMYSAGYRHGATSGFPFASHLLVFRMDNPTVPEIVSFTDIGGNSFGLAMSGDRIYSDNRRDGVSVIDISDPLQPVELKRLVRPDLPLLSIVESIAATGEQLFLSMGPDGIGHIGTSTLEDYPEPLVPESLISRQAMPKAISRVVLDGHLLYAIAYDQVYVLDTRGGKLVLRGTLRTDRQIWSVAFTRSALIVATEDGALVFPRLDPEQPAKMRYSGLEDF